MGNRAVKITLAIIGGMIAAIVTVMIAEGAGHLMFPPPAGLDVTDPADQARLMKELAPGAKIAVVLAWFLGSIVGAWTAMRASLEVLPGWAVAIAMIGLSFWTTQSFPHPDWMMVSAVVLPLLGALIARELHKRAGTF